MRYTNEDKLAERLVQYGREEEIIRRELRKHGSRVDNSHYFVGDSKRVVFKDLKYKGYPIMKLFIDTIVHLRLAGCEAFATTLTQGYIRDRLPYFEDYKIIDLMGTESPEADLETRKFFAKVFQNMKTHEAWTDEEIRKEFELDKEYEPDYYEINYPVLAKYEGHSGSANYIV